MGFFLSVQKLNAKIKPILLFPKAFQNNLLCPVKNVTICMFSHKMSSIYPFNMLGNVLFSIKIYSNF